MGKLPPTLQVPPRKSALSSKPLIWIAPILLLLVPCFWYMTWRDGNTHAVSRIQRAARAGGEPLNFSELAAAYGSIPAESNAYVALEAIWEREDPLYWKTFKAGERNVPEHRRVNDPTNVPFLDWSGQKLQPGTRLTPSAVEATAEFIQSQREHLSDARKALERPDFHAPIAFEDSFAALLPYVSCMKREAVLFRVEAALAAEKQQPDQALDGINEISRLAHCLEKDPLLIGQLTRLAICSMALNSAERLLSQTSLNQNQLERLTVLISGLQATNGLRRALVGERAMLFGFLDSPYKTFLASADPTEDTSPERSAAMSAIGLKLMSVTGWISAEKRLSGETFEELFHCAQNLDFATNDHFTEIITNMERQARQFPPKFFTALLVPPLGRAGQRFAQAEAQRRCAEVAVRIELYRSQHQGRLPTTLNDPRN